MAAAPSGLPGPAPPRAAGWGRAGLFPEARAGAVACPSLQPLKKIGEKIKVFPLPPLGLFFFPPSSGFRLPDVSGHPRRRRASGGPGPALGRTRRAHGLQLPPPGPGRPAGSGLLGSRGGGGASVAPGRLPPEAGAPRSGARDTPADHGRPGSHLPRRLRGAAPAAARSPRRLPASERGAARPGEAGAPVRERAGAPRAPGQPPAPPALRGLLCPEPARRLGPGGRRCGERRGGAAARTGVRGSGLPPGGVIPTRIY